MTLIVTHYELMQRYKGGAKLTLVIENVYPEEVTNESNRDMFKHLPEVYQIGLRQWLISTENKFQRFLRSILRVN